MKRNDAGFTLIELAFVTGISVVIASVAVIQLRPTRAVLEAQSVSNLVISQMNYGRQVAIDERRNVLIEFKNNNEIKVTRLELDGTSTVLSDMYLSSGYHYGLPPGTPSDTPEHFGIASPVSFKGATGGTFLGDGTFVDNAGVVLNGTIYTIGAGNSGARAVTLTGATGRVLQYLYVGGAWKQS